MIALPQGCKKVKKSLIAITLSTILGSGSAWAATDMSSIEARLAAMEKRLAAAEQRASVAEHRAQAAEQQVQKLSLRKASHNEPRLLRSLSRIGIQVVTSGLAHPRRPCPHRLNRVRLLLRSSKKEISFLW